MPSMSIAMSLRGQLMSSFKFSPLSLFAGSVVGVWYDPNDITTLFQDTAGTTPITTTGQSVALMLDKSGNAKHASQSTAGSRPIYGIIPYGGLRNILVSTDTLATQTVVVSAVAQTLSFTGTGSVDLSGVYIGTLTGTGASNQVSLTFTPTTGNLTLTVTGSVTFAQLEKGSVVTAYQKSTTKYNVTEVGKSSVGVLWVDGTDDFMVTPSIDFSGSDKMTVWAGLQKLGNSQGILTELSPTNSSPGMFNLQAPGPGSVSYRFASGGSLPIAGIADASGYASPSVNILTGIAEISTDKAILQVNNVQVSSGSSDQGTGNYGNYPMYLFRRGGTTLPFNGVFTGLIVRGAASTNQQIYDGNTYLNNILGAY